MEKLRIRTDEEFDKYWVSVQINIPENNLQNLLLLKKALNQRGKKLFLLSNINQLHIKDALALFPKEKQNWDEYFDKTFFSCELGFRKPEIDIYKYILKDQNLRAERVFFIDDMKVNVEAALALGIRDKQLNPTTDDFYNLLLRE
ncbi:MAG: HAD-IA family hydrolase [Oligoflexia bacterium]|nr:HAD-IA family hydrolase [Oligoflexia bacterium]